MSGRTRLLFSTQAAANVFAAAVHTRMIAQDRAYATAVARGQIARWAFPYQDEGNPTNWFVNVKERCADVLTAGERSSVVNGRLDTR